MPYSSGHSPYIATDEPDYGYLGFFGWDCSDWKIWYYTLKNNLGKAAADLRWNKAWNDQSFWNVDYSFCKYESDFHQFITDENLNASDVIADTAYSAINSVENLGKSLEATSTVIKWGVPVLIGSAVLIAIIVFAKSAPKVTPSMAARVLQKHKNGKK